MTDKIEELKTALRNELKKVLSDETVKVTFTLNSYGFYTQIEQRTAESLRDENVSMRNLKGEWIIGKNKAICNCENEYWKEDEGGDWYCTIHDKQA